MVVRGNGIADFDRLVVELVDDFDHYDRVEAGGDRIAGVDPRGLRADLEADRGGLGGADRVRGAHGHPVHRRAVVVGRGDARPDRLGRNPSQRPFQGESLGPGQGKSARLSERRLEVPVRLLQRDVAEVVAPPFFPEMRSHALCEIAGASSGWPVSRS